MSQSANVANTPHLSPPVAIQNTPESFVPLRDRLILGPIDRYKKYGHFPYKFMIHIVMMLLTALQVYLMVSMQVTFS